MNDDGESLVEMCNESELIVKNMWFQIKKRNYIFKCTLVQDSEEETSTLDYIFGPEQVEE